MVPSLSATKEHVGWRHAVVGWGRKRAPPCADGVVGLWGGECALNGGRVRRRQASRRYPAGKTATDRHTSQRPSIQKTDLEAIRACTEIVGNRQLISPESMIDTCS
ncbi:hypothetical protein ES705_19574 [subsurface metagenome]